MSDYDKLLNIYSLKPTSIYFHATSTYFLATSIYSIT